MCLHLKRRTWTKTGPTWLNSVIGGADAVEGGTLFKNLAEVGVFHAGSLVDPTHRMISPNLRLVTFFPWGRVYLNLGQSDNFVGRNV